MKKIVTIGIFIYSVYLFISRLLSYAYSNFDITFYDGMYRLLPHFFIRQGLIPYKQFEFGYGPGLFILIGNIFPFVSIAQRNMVLAAVTCAFIFFGIFLLVRMNKTIWKAILPVSAFLILQSVLFEYLSWSDPISLVLVADLFILILFALTSKKESKLSNIGVVIIAFLLVFLRWDWILGISALFILGFRYTWRVTKYIVLGVLAGIMSLGMYLYGIGALREAMDSMVFSQLTLNAAYRRIQFSQLSQIPEVFGMVGSIVLAIAGFGCVLYFLPKFRSMWKDERGVLINIIVCCVAFLPYSLSRMDQTHIVPLLYSIGLACILLYILITHWSIIVVFLILLYPVSTRLITDMPLIPPNTNGVSQFIEASIADCKSALPDTATYASLFVGRLNYDKTITSNAMLYFINSTIPPATAYFLDVPGRQTSCEGGDKIVSQLKASPKPMLTFIDMQNYDVDTASVSELKSCGNIESYLTSARYKTIGVCRAFEHQFLIRIYE